MSLMSPLQRLIEAHDLAPVVVGQPSGEPLVVDLASVETLHVFADAVEKAITTEDGETFVVAHEVDGVPTLWRATLEPEAVPT